MGLADGYVQGALDSLPVEGGTLLLHDLSVNSDGNYVHYDYVFSDEVSVYREVNNVHIIGMGASTVVKGDGVTPLFTVGGTGWLFTNLSLDSGGVDKNGFDDCKICESWVGGEWFNECGGNYTGNETVINSFKDIVTGNGTVEADSPIDTLTITSGDGSIVSQGYDITDMIDLVVSAWVTVNSDWDTISKIESATSSNIYVSGEMISDSDLSGNITRDTEWDTVGKIESAVGDNILTAGELDTVGKLETLVGDNVLVDGELDTKAKLESVTGADLEDDTHASSHVRGGADELNLVTGLAGIWSYSVLDYNSYDAWTTYKTGTGAITSGYRNCVLTTGATNGSKVQCYVTSHSMDGWYNNYDASVLITTDGLTACTMYIGFYPDAAPPVPTDTCNQVGFKILDGSIYASCGNGVSGTQTDTTVDLTEWGSFNLYLENHGSYVDFYVNGGNKRTISTNLPTSNYSKISAYMTNTAAAAKNLQVVRWIIAAEDAP